MDPNDYKTIDDCIIKLTGILDSLNSVIPNAPRNKINNRQFIALLRDIADVINTKEMWNSQDIIDVVIECVQLREHVYIDGKKFKKNL